MAISERFTLVLVSDFAFKAQLRQILNVLGFRLPFYIISPWTRGGNVFVEHADHISQLKFVGKALEVPSKHQSHANHSCSETWLSAKGFNATTDQIPPWRRDHMSDLVKAFDFNNVCQPCSLFLENPLTHNSPTIHSQTSPLLRHH
jgi:phospholipase C